MNHDVDCRPAERMTRRRTDRQGDPQLLELVIHEFVDVIELGFFRKA